MELDEEIYNKMSDLCSQADDHVKICEFNRAVSKYEDALDLLPGNLEDYYEATNIYAAMGDAWCLAGEYKKAKNYFYDALNCPGGIANSYILFRLGECLYECNEKDKAKEYFIKTYMIDGINLFNLNDYKYFSIIKELVR
ncbi:hypothetical protein EXM65_17005 [Clostridium botulinum]|uniref:Uncharacterized protein n=1 Tax=Clostridium botulinum TaxID=1491 RepID=A0A6M0SWW1_CLOBO|nr:hypothetical protein [Clostridium botulinum]